MKKLIIILLLFPILSFGQTEYIVKKFSEKYSAKVKVEKGSENEVFKKGVVSIIDNRSNREIIKIVSEEISFDLNEQGQVKTNVAELPYGEQSIIIYQDFDFDGKKDLAIMDGQFSCYHLPSYAIYLERDNTLKHSPEFSELAHEYCGMFEVDNKTKTLKTMTKSGYTSRQFSTFEVVKGKPKVKLIINENLEEWPFLTTTTTVWKGRKETKTIKRTIDLDQEETTKLVSFKLVKSQKEVVLFFFNKNLNYVLIKPGGEVEFSFPLSIYADSRAFTLNKNGNRLTFENGNAVYQIYENRTGSKVSEIGILVTVDGKKYDLKGDLRSLTGTLRNLQKENPDNVTNE